MSSQPTTRPGEERSVAPNPLVSPWPTYAIGVVFLLVAILFAMASPEDWYGAFKTIHVVFAVVWIGGGVLISVLAFIAEQERDVEGRMLLARQAASVSNRVFVPSSLVVLAFGIAMMLNDLGEARWDWGDFWVTFGLIGYAATFGIGIGLLGPAAKRMEGLMAAGKANSAEVHAEMNRIFLIARADAAILMLVVVDMVAKPFL